MSNKSTSNTTPQPDDPNEVMRWHNTRFRHRLITGQYLSDLESRMSDMFGLDRSRSWGVPDQSINCYKSIIQQLAVLYTSSPDISVLDDDGSIDLEATERLKKDVDDIFRFHSELNEKCEALGEMLIFVDVSQDVNDDSKKHINIELVRPDEVVVEDSYEMPGEPVRIQRLVCMTYRGHEVWFWFDYDMRFSEPVFKATVALDVDSKDLNLKQGTVVDDIDDWRWYRRDNTPFMPFVMYHTKFSNKLFNDTCNHELADGTLSIAALWSFWDHGFKDASWPQRVTIGLRPAGVVPSPELTTRRIVTDPGYVLEFDHSSDTRDGRLENWAQTFDPLQSQQAIDAKMMTILSAAGFNNSDFTVKDSSQSGVSLSIKKESVRLQIKQRQPSYKKSDRRLLSLIASSLYDYLPEDENAYDIKYSQLPLSIEERQSKITEVTQKINLLKELKALNVINDEEFKSMLAKEYDTIR